MVTEVETEEVCDACGSTNIGYDALVKNIGGELEVVGGPYDSCQCINCQNLETHVRSVPVQNLRYCDGQNCYYQGDKDVMNSKPMTKDTDEGINQITKEEWYWYWYCFRCTKEANVPEEDIVGKLDIIANRGSN